MDSWFTPLPLQTPGSDRFRSRKSLSRAFAAGDLVRVRHGFYADSDTWWDATAAQRYATTVKAVAGRLHQPVFTGVTALILHGLPVLESPATVDVLTSTPSRVGLQGTITAYHHLHFNRSAEPPYVPRTKQVYAPAARPTADLSLPQLNTSVSTLTLERVVQETAPDLDFCAALTVADSLLSGRNRDGIRWDGATLRHVLTPGATSPSAASPARVLRYATDLSESPGESLSRARMIELGFELPELQVTTRGIDGHDYRPDFWWRKLNLIGEFDGWGKYGPVDASGSSSEALRREKRREDALRGTGLRVMRWGWEDVMDPDRFATLLVRHGVPRRRRASIRWTA